jgi:hypothetical protein
MINDKLIGKSLIKALRHYSKQKWVGPLLMPNLFLASTKREVVKYTTNFTIYYYNLIS